MLHVAAQMVSPISNDKGGRFCPALDCAITAKRCGNERLTALACPLNCPYNPFNPNAPQSFDAVLTKGLPAAAKWIEEGIGPNEWARRFDAMDRRFHPERDLPLIAYETQWAVLAMSRAGEAYGSLWQSYRDGTGAKLRNDARIFLEKLADSRAMLLEVTVASNALPYYTCREVHDPDKEYLYVDFGDQEPLEAGAILFGRFLRHENCLYVVPGIFVGTPEILPELIDELDLYLKVGGPATIDAMQSLVPEIWGICARIQDVHDELDADVGESPFAEDEAEGEHEPCRVDLMLIGAKAEAVRALRDHPLFIEESEQEFGFDPLGDTIFNVYVTPSRQYVDKDGFLEGGEVEDEDLFGDEEDDDDEGADAEKPVKVGTVFLSAERIAITGMNGVELELVKALVMALIPSSEG